MYCNVLLASGLTIIFFTLKRGFLGCYSRATAKYFGSGVNFSIKTCVPGRSGSGARCLRSCRSMARVSRLLLRILKWSLFVYLCSFRGNFRQTRFLVFIHQRIAACQTVREASFKGVFQRHLETKLTFLLWTKLPFQWNVSTVCEKLELSKISHHNKASMLFCPSFISSSVPWYWPVLTYHSTLPSSASPRRCRLRWRFPLSAHEQSVSQEKSRIPAAQRRRDVLTQSATRFHRAWKIRIIYPEFLLILVTLDSTI